MGKRKTDYEWLKDRMEILCKYPELSKIEGSICNDAKYWTALKIIAISYFASTYKRIMKKRTWLDNMYYIDLFAGSGLCKIDDYIIQGSAVAVADAARDSPFDNMFLIEKDINKANALEKRLKYLSTLDGFENLKYQVINGDCNKVIPSIIEKIYNGNKTHSLVFVDPYGMEINWDTSKMLLEQRSDFVFTLQSFLLSTRSFNRAKVWENDVQTIKKFIGNENFSLEILNLKPDELLNKYKKNISFYKDIAIDCPIKGMRKHSYYYDWILAVKKTKGNSPWIDSALTAKKRIEKLNGSLVKQALDEINGEQSPLDKWF